MPETSFQPHHIAIILNPAAGRGRGAQMRLQAEEMLKREAAEMQEPPDWEFIETTAPGTGAELAARAIEKGADLIVAAGGDGTLAEALNGVFGSKAALGLLPFGTGNDCARTLGMGTDLALAVRTILHGVPERIDIGKTQGRCFMNVAGFGFDAIVADRVNRGVRFLHGMPAYLVGVLLSLPRMRPVPVRLTLDDQTQEIRAILCSVANTRSYGGGMLIAPDAKVNDGLFDVCILGDVGTLEFLRAFPSVFKGQHIHHPKVRMARAQYVRAETESPLPVLIDGEVIGTTPADFQIFPQSVTFMVPAPLR